MNKKGTAGPENKDKIRNGMIGGIFGGAAGLCIIGSSYIGNYFDHMLPGIVIGFLLSLVLIFIAYLISK